MVSRSARPRRRPDRSGIRCRHGRDCHPHPRHDPRYGYESAFLWFGLGQGLIIVLLSQLLRAPQAGEAPKPAARLTHSLRDYRPLEILRSPIFWVLYVMFVLVSASGLVVTAQIAPIAKDFGLAEQPMTIFFVTATR
jgi:OFA family oxalate/formate antiporter-like MFS transporter